MLTTRNAILVAAGVLVLSILASVFSMLKPRDSDGKARDSYGTQAAGYRGLYEVLEELGVPVERELAPPQAEKLDDQTLLLIGPHAQLIRTGPKYVAALLEWVEQGGRLVVAPPAHISWRDSIQQDMASKATPQDVLEVLELDESLSLNPVEQATADWWKTEPDLDFEDIWSRNEQPVDPPQVVDVTVSGALESLKGEVQKLALQPEGMATLVSDQPPDGEVTYFDSAGAKQLLVAVVKRGEGEIVVLSDPRLWSNRLLALADNSVLAAKLLTPNGEPVVFDEFYHGLSVRGNILYLFTLPGFSAIALTLLLGIGVWAWRSAVFLGPPLPDPVRSRRDVREYVDAMAHFFEKGFDALPFLAHELRDGVLRQLSQEVKLPVETADVEAISTALRRHSPQRASKLVAAISELDDQLAAGGPSKAQFVPIMQRLVSCL